MVTVCPECICTSKSGRGSKTSIDSNPVGSFDLITAPAKTDTLNWRCYLGNDSVTRLSLTNKNMFVPLLVTTAQELGSLWELWEHEHFHRFDYGFVDLVFGIVTHGKAK